MTTRALSVLSLWIASGACYPAGVVPCLSGEVPSLPNRPAASELLELARLEYDRSQDGDPALRARLLERFPSLLPSVGARRPVPDCAREFVEREAEAAFASRPIEYSALLLARIRAVGNVSDTTDVMPAKATFLLDLAQLGDGELGSYQATPGEIGTPPPKAFVRELATGELAASNLFLNDQRVRAFLSARAAASRDPRELLLVHSATAQLFSEGPLGRRPGDLQSRLLAGWLDELPARVATPAPEERELLLLRLKLIGRYANTTFAGERALSLVRELLPRTRELGCGPADRGFSRDLAVALRSALFDLERGVEHRQVPFGDWPRALRRVPDYASWSSPTRLPLEGARERRLAQIQDDVEHFRYAGTRCAILSEVVALATPANAGSLFDFLVTPAAEPRKRPVEESICRIETALELPGLGERKAAHLVRLLYPRRLARDEEGLVESVVASALAAHPELLQVRPELLRWLDSKAELPPFRVAARLQPAVIHLLSAPSAEPSRARRAAILRAWIADLRAPSPKRAGAMVLRARYLTDSPGYAESLRQERLWVIAELAEAHELEAEARALVAEIASRRFHADDHGKLGMARAAALAETLLDQP